MFRTKCFTMSKSQKKRKKREKGERISGQREKSYDIYPNENFLFFFIFLPFLTLDRVRKIDCGSFLPPLILRSCDPSYSKPTLLMLKQKGNFQHRFNKRDCLFYIPIMVHGWHDTFFQLSMPKSQVSNLFSNLLRIVNSNSSKTCEISKHKKQLQRNK
jgi:hypothetical protein